MNPSNLSPRSYGILAAVLVALAAVGGFIWITYGRSGQRPATPEQRVTEKESKGVKFKRPQEAQDRGIAAQAVKSMPWRPKLHLDGRVVPNPAASLELRAPFAGIIRIASAESKLRLGAAIDPEDTLALFEARFTGVERLDFQTKLVDAEARHKYAEDIVKIR